jgi:hypothetical protein
MLEFSHSLMATLLAPIAHREIDKAYGSHAAAWRPLTSRTDPTHFGRKRRARRARGWWIEARQALGHGHWFRVQLDSASGFRSKPIGPTTRIFNVDIPTCIDELDSFLDPSLGEPWEEQAHDSWNVGLPPATGYYYVRGLLDESIGGNNRPVYVNPEYFVWGFTEDDDPESITIDSDITPENIRWKPAEAQADG